MKDNLTQKEKTTTASPTATTDDDSPGSGANHSVRFLVRHPSADLSFLGVLTGMSPNLSWAKGAERRMPQESCFRERIQIRSGVTPVDSATQALRLQSNNGWSILRGRQSNLRASKKRRRNAQPLFRSGWTTEHWRCIQPWFAWQIGSARNRIGN